MFPIIFQIGPVSVYSYGLMLALGVVLCSFLLSREVKDTDLSMDVLLDLIFWVVLSGIVGARIFYIFLNQEFFLSNPLEMIMLQKGGLAWQGSLILGTLSGIIFIKIKGLELFRILDLIAPYLALGQSLGRIGCFFNGCCFGREVSWGIYFPVHQAHLHPTQLYSSLGLLMIFFFLRSFRKHAVRGDVFILYLILASTLRFFVEFFRADHDVYGFGLSIFQFVCLGLIGIAIIIKMSNLKNISSRK